MTCISENDALVLYTLPDGEWVATKARRHQELRLRRGAIPMDVGAGLRIRLNSGR